MITSLKTTCNEFYFAYWEISMFHSETGCFILLLRSRQLCCILDILWTHFDLILAGSQLSWITMTANTLQFLSVNTSHSFFGKQPYAMFLHYSFLTQRAEFSCCLWRKKKKKKRQSNELLLYLTKLNLSQCRRKICLKPHYAAIPTGKRQFQFQGLETEVRAGRWYLLFFLFFLCLLELRGLNIGFYCHAHGFKATPNHQLLLHGDISLRSVFRLK